MRAAPSADPGVVRLALHAMNCAEQSGHQRARRLAIIDYSRPSTERRLWVFDLATSRLLFHERVAHGRNSGDNLAVSFSNAPHSRASSLGLFRTLAPYNGNNGYSLRLAGLERGVNNNALSRAIVIHGAAYVGDTGPVQARIGRSWGCPAVRRAVARPIIDSLKDGNYVFAYYPDAAWLKSSPYLNCKPQTQVVRAPILPNPLATLLPPQHGDASRARVPLVMSVASSNRDS